VHPGAFISPAQLATIRARVAARAEPTTSFLAASQASVQGSASYAPFGPPADGLVTCGSYDKPNIGCSNQTSDADAAYLSALYYSISGDETAAARSARILALWASNFRGFRDSNAPLQASWVAAKLVRAAELLRASPAFPPAARGAVATMLLTLHLPLFIDCLPENGNWGLSAIEAMAGIAVVSENATLLARAHDLWRARVPAYFYIASDGPAPHPLPCGRGDTNWYNQSVFDAETSGVCQETCRDFGHMQMGFGAAINAAATLFAQGIDAFADEAPRLVAAAEFATTYLLGAPAPPVLCSGAPLKLAHVATWEVAYAALATRLGHAMPRTWEYIGKAVRSVSGQDGIVSVWETLTHGEPAAAA
jgi:hypothetical protein